MLANRNRERAISGRSMTKYRGPSGGKIGDRRVRLITGLLGAGTLNDRGRSANSGQ